MSAIYCNFANPIISDAVNVPHVSVEINKRFYYYYCYVLLLILLFIIIYFIIIYFIIIIINYYYLFYYYFYYYYYYYLLLFILLLLLSLVNSYCKLGHRQILKGLVFKKTNFFFFFSKNWQVLHTKQVLF